VAAKAVNRHRGQLKRKGERKQRKRIEDAVQYALGHHVRLEILILLSEGSFTTSEIAEQTGIEFKKVSNHVLRMWEDGSVEVAKWEKRHGTIVNWYRAVELPEITTEEAEAMNEMELQMVAGVIAQGQTAELMAALHKGTLASPRTIQSWDLYAVDGKGRKEIEDEVHRHLERLREIKCNSANRVAVSKEETTSMIVSVAAFVRARKIREPAVSEQ
jgi:predicted transcriptional regulator